MRTLCPNLERDDVLETVLEVPVPEEIFASAKHKSWQSIKSWLTRPHVEKGPVPAGRDVEIQFLLGVIGAPLIPLPVRCDRTINDHNIKGHPIESSMAKYIVQQYIAASGGEHALNSINSMCAMGKVRMAASEFVAGDNLSLSNSTKLRSRKHGRPGELGGFVLWQKSPDMWNLELMVSGCKMSVGSNGKVAWRQTPWQHSHASRGPPRPLRRSLQGLDPRSTANLFSNSVCIGEKTVNNEDCFVLKLEADPSTLRARSSSNVEIIRHTIWGCFSQRTGLLIQLEDSHLLRIKSSGGNDILWETTMESSIQDYRTINGVNIAHAGTTTVLLFRFGENSKTFNTRSRMEEEWSVEEVDFNIKGLSREFFLPPADLRKEDEECGVVANGGVVKSGG
ncbi:UNVERIFIED_CONTAM: hypothetical protein Scaly_2485600 [Sesamum calycinum]|uniref:Uncharacterized protein n=1 Tax=Sesamum calycinum TaxID=2727403 RepID=A0AAW2LST4_9LAMI